MSGRGGGELSKAPHFLPEHYHHKPQCLLSVCESASVMQHILFVFTCVLIMICTLIQSRDTE